MKIISPALSKIARLRCRKMEEWIVDPDAIQREVLQDLVTHGQHTVFGCRHNFDKLFRVRDFKDAVPIQEYCDLLPYVDALMHGEQFQLWDGPVNWFAKSSGTSAAKSKFIPITEESLEDCHYQGAKDVLSMYYNFNPESDLLTGKGLIIGGSHQVSKINDESYFGDLSAVLMQNAPFWGQWIRTPELSIALMDEWENKIEALAETTMNENVTSISGVPTWTMVLLKRILEISGKQTIKEVWPSLELYMHGGVSFVPYKEHFNKLFGAPVHYIEIYNASEGFFAAQENPYTDGMLLLLDHGIFYEFMPVEEYGNDNPQTIGLKEVELNKNYAPVITTNGGLWRYLVGDTIQFTSLNPFRIKVSGRLKHFMNAFGEEVIVDNADVALAQASKKTNTAISDYTAAPVYFSDDNNGAHEWLIEFDKAPENIELFTYELDNALKNINSDYEAKRQKNIALRMPIVHAVKKGSFNNWLKSKGKLGGQHKVPRLSNNRDVLDELKAFITCHND